MADPTHPSNDSPFMKACRRERTSVTPVWLMRQAGRYMEEYRRVRDKVPFLQLCRSPELAAEVAIVAQRKIGADAAILFSDILLILQAMGLPLEFTAGEGPVLSHPIRSRKDLDRLREVEPAESLGYVFDAVRATRAGLDPHVPLIGFCGAPFTLAAYAIEGGHSRDFATTKAFLYQEPEAWRGFLRMLSRGLVKYLNGQIAAGAQAVQIFDSWVGCVSASDYEEFILPATREVVQGVPKDVPVILFGTGTGHLLESMKKTGATVIGLDYRVELDEEWDRLGPVAVQGNLDPSVLLTGRKTIQAKAARILAQAGGRPGHIFNLGHGVLPATPVDHVKFLIDYVHDESIRQGGSTGVA